MPCLPQHEFAFALLQIPAEGELSELRSKWSESPELTSMLAFVVGVLLLVLLGIFWSWLQRRSQGKTGAGEGTRFGRQWVVVILALAVLLTALLLSPVDEATKAEIVQVLGVLLPAAVALSATAFLGNAMAGLVLRRMANFRMGDFIQVGEYFGRVSERTLMHTEIQTEDRDLTTLPNLLLVTSPMKVVRRTGTVVSATVSLGYDVPWSKVETALLEAGKRAALKEPFVQVQELGDFSVLYRVAGMLEDVRAMFAKRSDLRTHMLDCLHEADIQILSPNYINLRSFSENAPDTLPGRDESEAQAGRALGATPTDLIFDKAESAAALASRKADLVSVEKELAACDPQDEASMKLLVQRKTRLLSHIAYLQKVVQENQD
ncbi:MAG: mechanosensitive ion channel family protein [Planctomycetota bacterium]|nr:mechanosensitive ion channel family protein [Planctomycetota bacterium]